MDGWWSRDGRLCLSMAFAGGVVACGEMAPLPELSPTGSETTTALITPDEFVPAMLADQFAGDAPQQPLCGDPLLGADFVLEDSALPTTYVDAATRAAIPDGSASAPFRTIRQAFVAASNAAPVVALGLAPTRRVLVASGQYNEDVAVPAGAVLLGGYDAQTWQLGVGESVIGGSVYLGTSTLPDGIVSAQGTFYVSSSSAPPPVSTAPLTALKRFSVESGLEVVSGARALLRENVIAPLFFTSASDGALRAIAVWVNEASVRADHNRVILPLEKPLEVISGGISTHRSCALITQNEITDYRSPIGLDRNPAAAATFNVLRRVENGIWTGGNQALIAGNLIDTHMPFSGCVYAIIMSEDAHPDIRNNKIFLNDVGNNGMLEEHTSSLPTALLGNRFYSPRSSPALYIDHRGPTELRHFVTAASVNALPGIPTIGDNTFAMVAAKR